MSDIPKIYLTLPSGETRKYSLQMDSIRIGRAADNTVMVEDGSLSAHHAVLHRRETGYELVDLGSTNGLEFQGRRVLTHDLRHGDEIKIGSVLLRFEWADMPPPAPAPELPPVAPAADSVAGAPVAQDEKDSEPERARPARSGGGVTEEGKGGCLAACALFALTLLAPVIGMHVRHFQETNGQILISEIIQHRQKAAPAAPTEAKP